MTPPRPTTEEAGQIIGCDHIAWGSVAECPYCGVVNDMVPKAVHREEVAEALATARPTTEEGRPDAEPRTKAGRAFLRYSDGTEGPHELRQAILAIEAEALQKTEPGHITATDTLQSSGMSTEERRAFRMGWTEATQAAAPPSEQEEPPAGHRFRGDHDCFVADCKSLATELAMARALLRAASTPVPALDVLQPWLRHGLYPACNLTMMPESLKPGRHVCTCGLDDAIRRLSGDEGGAGE